MANPHIGRCRNSDESRADNSKRNACATVGTLTKPLLIAVFKEYYDMVDDSIIYEGVTAKGQPKEKKKPDILKSMKEAMNLTIAGRILHDEKKVIPKK